MHSIIYAHCGATLRQEPRRCSAEAAGAARHHQPFGCAIPSCCLFISPVACRPAILAGIRLTQGGVTAMEIASYFGRTGMQLSVLGFGCGAVGGLMVARAIHLDQERTNCTGDRLRRELLTTRQSSTATANRKKNHRTHSCKSSNRRTWSSAPRSGCQAVTSAALPTRWRSRSKVVGTTTPRSGRNLPPAQCSHRDRRWRSTQRPTGAR